MSVLIPEFIRKMFPEIDFDEDEPSETPEEDGVGWDPDCPWTEDDDRAQGGVKQPEVV